MPSVKDCIKRLTSKGGLPTRSRELFRTSLQSGGMKDVIAMIEASTDPAAAAREAITGIQQSLMDAEKAAIPQPVKTTPARPDEKEQAQPVQTQGVETRGQQAPAARPAVGPARAPAQEKPRFRTDPERFPLVSKLVEIGIKPLPPGRHLAKHRKDQSGGLRQSEKDRKALTGKAGYDDAPTIGQYKGRPIAQDAIRRMFRVGATQEPDTAMQEAFGDDKVKAAYESGADLWDAVHQELQEMDETQEDSSPQEQQAVEFYSAVAEGKIEIQASELRKGDTINIEGEDAVVSGIDYDESDNPIRVTLKDGRRFGRQTVMAGDILFVEGYEPAKRPETDDWPSVDDLTLEKQTDESIDTDRERAEAQRKAAEQKQAMQDKAAAPLTGKDDTGQGVLLEEDADLFSGPAYGSGNKIVTLARREAMRKEFLNSLGRTQSGLSPRQILNAVELAVFHIEAQLRDKAHKFATWVKAMKADLGDAVSDSDLKDIYWRARSYFTGEDIPPDPSAPPQLTEQEAAVISEGGTGIKNAATDFLREKYGLEAAAEIERQTHDEVLQSAVAAIRKDPEYPARLHEELIAQPRQLDAVEEAVLMMENLKWQAVSDKWMSQILQQQEAGNDTAVSEAMAPLQEAQAKLQSLFDIERAAGTAWGRAGNFRRRMMHNDYSLARMTAQFRTAANRGGPLDAGQAKIVNDLHNELAAAQKRIAELEAEDLDARVEQVLSDILSQARAVKKEASAAKREGKTVRVFLKESADAAKQRILERRGQLGSGFQILSHIKDLGIIGAHYLAEGAVKLKDFTARLIADFGDDIKEHAGTILEASREIFDGLEESTAAEKKAAKARGKAMAQAAIEAADGDALPERNLVAALVKAHVVAGKHGSKDVFSAVTADLQEAFPGITERQVKEIFTEYGQAKFPSQDAVKKELRELRTIGQLELTIERLENKLAPLKTGPQRDKATAEISRLQKLVTDLKRKHGFTNRGEGQLAGVMDAVKTRLRNDIGDLNARIAAGGSTPEQLAPRPGLKYDEETIALQKERDDLKAILAELDGPKEISEARRIELTLAALDRTQELLERQLLTGEKPKRAGQPAVTNEEIEARRSYNETLRAELKERAAATKERKSISEKAEQAKLRALETAEKRYQELLAKKDIAPKGKKQGVDSKEVAEAKAKRDAAKKDWEDYKKTREVEINHASDLKRIERRIEELEEKLRKKDFSKKPEKNRAYDDKQRKAIQNEEVKFQLLQEQWNNMLFEETLKDRSLDAKAIDTVREVFHLARLLQLGMDFGAVFRQGLFAVGRGKAFRSAFMKGMESLWSEAGEVRTRLELLKDPDLPLYRQAGLELSEWGRGTLTNQEEAYMSRWFRKIPKFLGGGIARGTGRGQVTFLNKLRVEWMRAMSATLSRYGTPTLAEMKNYAIMVNVATGRGNLAQWEKSALEVMNTIFLAWRWTRSRVQYWTLHPLWYPWVSYRFNVGDKTFLKERTGTWRSTRVIAREYARPLTGIGLMIVMWNLIHYDDDDKRVELDPRSSKFLKIPIGNTLVDPTAGIASWLTFVTQLATGERKTQSGRIVKMRDEEDEKRDFGESVGNTMWNFLRSKFSPILGAVVNTFDGKDPGGQETTGIKEAGRLFIPLIAEDIVEAVQGNGTPKGLAISLLAFLGFSVRTKDLSDYEQVSDEDRNFLYNNQIVFSQLPEDETDGGLAGMTKENQKTYGRDKKLTDEQRKKVLELSTPAAQEAIQTARVEVRAIAVSQDDPDYGREIKRIETRLKRALEAGRAAAWETVKPPE